MVANLTGEEEESVEEDKSHGIKEGGEGGELRIGSLKSPMRLGREGREQVRSIDRSNTTLSGPDGSDELGSRRRGIWEESVEKTDKLLE